jgi:hypothetical protein
MDTYLAILAEAVSDISVWSWWTEGFPDFFQVEFAGTQLWSPPLHAGEPPSGVIALRFERPKSVSFVTSLEYLESWGPDWPKMLHDDKLDAMGLRQQLTFTDEAFLAQMIEDSGRIDTAFGFAPTCPEFMRMPHKLGFWAGPIGMMIGSDAMKILNHHGDIPPDQVGAMYQKWWEYWKEYWRLKDTKDALPRDFACEITIPAGQE